MAKARIQGLNPLVTIDMIPTASVLERDGLNELIQGVDLVCMTDWNKDDIVSSRNSKLISLVASSSMDPDVTHRGSCRSASMRLVGGCTSRFTSEALMAYWAISSVTCLIMDTLFRMFTWAK